MTLQPRRKSGSFASALGIAIASAFWVCGAQAQTQSAPDGKEPSLRFTVQAKDKLITFTQSVLADPKTWPEVARFNALKDANRINPGQQIDVPLRLLKFRAEQAQVLSASGDVSLAKGAMLAEGQQLRVGANSSAVLQLGDGSQVKVLPGTLAELAKNRQYMGRDPDKVLSTNWFSGVVRLVQGQVEVLATKTQRAESLKVQLPTAVIGVRGTVFRAGVAGANGKTEVIEGAVQADNPAQQSAAQVGAGFGAVVDPTQKEVKAVALLDAPAMPAPQELRQPQAVLAFAAVPGARSYRVQVAKDAAFNELVQDASGSLPQAVLSALPLGPWHVRARALDAIGLEGKDGVTRVSLLAPLPPPPPPPPPPAPAPNPYHPGALASATLLHEGSGTVMRLSGLTPGMLSHSVVIASDRALQTNARRFTAQPQLALGKLAAGEYFLRFQCNSPCPTDAQSPLYRLEVDESWGVSVVQQQSALTKVAE